MEQEDSNDSQKVVQCVRFPLNFFKLIFGSLTPGKCVEAIATVGGVAVAEVSLLETGGSPLESGASLLKAGVPHYLKPEFLQQVWRVV